MNGPLPGGTDSDLRFYLEVGVYIGLVTAYSGDVNTTFALGTDALTALTALSGGVSAWEGEQDDPSDVSGLQLTIHLDGYVETLCSYSAAPPMQTFDWEGGSAWFLLTTQQAPYCTWEPVSNDAWITVTNDRSPSPADQAGAGGVSYLVAPFLGQGIRTGTVSIMVAGTVAMTFTVTQNGSLYDISGVETLGLIVRNPRSFFRDSYIVKPGVVVNQGDLVAVDNNGYVVVAEKTLLTVVRPWGVAVFTGDNGTKLSLVGDGKRRVSVARKALLFLQIASLVPGVAPGLPVYLAAAPNGTTSNYTCETPSDAGDLIAPVGYVDSDGLTMCLDVSPTGALEIQNSDASIIDAG